MIRFPRGRVLTTVSVHEQGGSRLPACAVRHLGLAHGDIVVFDTDELPDDPAVVARRIDGDGALPKVFKSPVRDNGKSFGQVRITNAAVQAIGAEYGDELAVLSVPNVPGVVIAPEEEVLV